MYSRCRNPERRAAIARLLPIAFAAVLVVATNNAGAQQDTAPSAGRGPNEVSVTLMFAFSSSRRENALLARERFRMAATEQGRRRDHQNDG